MHKLAGSLPCFREKENTPQIGRFGKSRSLGFMEQPSSPTLVCIVGIAVSIKAANQHTFYSIRNCFEVIPAPSCSPK